MRELVSTATLPRGCEGSVSDVHPGALSARSRHTRVRVASLAWVASTDAFEGGNMESALALAVPYAPPALAFAGEPAETEDVIWWIVVVGFAYAVALAWATWCRRDGGSAEISFGWTGFKVVCRSS